MSGAAGITWMGAWSSLVTYLTGMAVSYAESSWVAVTSSTNSAPAPGNPDWDIISLGGALALAIGALGAPTAGGLTFAAGTNTLSLTAADATRPGGVSAVAQTFGGDKTFPGGLLSDTLQTATATSLTLKSSMVDGASALAAIIDTAAAWSAAGAKLQSWRTNNVEKAYIDKDGGLNIVGVASGSVGVQVPQGVKVAFTNSTVYLSNDGSGDLLVSGGNGSLRCLQITNSNNSMTFRGGAADGATAVSVILNNAASLTTAGAKLLSIRNNTAEKAYIDKDGGMSLGAGGPIASAQTYAMREMDVLLSARDIYFANSYATNYNVDGTLNYETWTDTQGTPRLRKRTEYTYSGGLVATKVIKVYSAADGTTIVAQTTETFTYTAGVLSSSSTVRNV